MAIPPPTNRSRQHPKSAQLPQVRIDTLAMRGRIADHSLARLSADTMRLRDGEVVETRGTAELDCGVTLRFDSKRGAPEASLEFSVPRFLNGSNSRGSSLADVESAIQQVYEDATNIVEWLEPPEHLSLMRLDLVRDFTAEGGAERHLAGLAMVPAKQARTRSHHTADGLGVETLYRETTRWLGRLYLRDNLPGARTKALGEPQHVRFELQLRSGFLREHGIADVESLQEGSLGSIALHHFNRCRLAVPVGDPDAKVRAALKGMAHLSESDRRGMLGQLRLDALYGVLPTRNHTVLKYRRLAADHGLTPADGMWRGTPAPESVRFLDFTSGLLRNVEEAA